MHVTNHVQWDVPGSNDRKDAPMSCEICQRIKAMNDNPHLVYETKLGFIVLGDSQFIPGYTVYLSKAHVQDMNDLPIADRQMIMQEVFIVGGAVLCTFNADRVHYALLGRESPESDTRHVHWHIVPRRKGDLRNDAPLWSIPVSLRNSPQYVPDTPQLDAFVIRLRTALSTANLSSVS